MKDFYDIWLLSRQFDFDGQNLATAVAQTFANRNTAFPDEVSAFSARFIAAKQVQWQAFRNRLKQDHIPEAFVNVVQAIATFLQPIVATQGVETPCVARWNAPGPWE
jgi:hypothetical protein